MSPHLVPKTQERHKIILLSDTSLKIKIGDQQTEGLGAGPGRWCLSPENGLAEASGHQRAVGTVAERKPGPRSRALAGFSGRSCLSEVGAPSVALTLQGSLESTF